MKEFKGTKGEWKAEKPKQSNGFWYVNTEEITMGGLATCYTSNSEEETEFNAKLIAAAPELLEALQMFVDYCYGTELQESERFKKGVKAIEKALND